MRQRWLGGRFLLIRKPVEPLGRLRQRIQKRRAVGVLVTEEDRVPLVSACGHMIQGASKLQSQGAGHVANA